MEEFKIRKATIEDAEQIVALLSELGYPNTSALVQSKIANLSKSNIDTVLVAETDDKVVGVAHLQIAELFHTAGRLGRIMALVITDRYRRLGVGERLMESLEKVARNSGCVKIEVTSSIHREGAHSFYKNLGYTEKPKRFIKQL